MNEFLSSLPNLFAENKLNTGFGLFFVIAAIILVLLIIILKLFLNGNQTDDADANEIKSNIFMMAIRTMLAVLVMSAGIWIIINDKSARMFSFILVVGGGLSAVFYVSQIVKIKR